MIKFLKYFLTFILMSFLSSCFLFSESGYYKGNTSDHFDGKRFFNPNSEDPLKKKLHVLLQSEGKI